MTYSESAAQTRITGERASQEVRKHSCTVSTFWRECWLLHASKDADGVYRIEASKVLAWLGY